jgi:hypothetical protein
MFDTVSEKIRLKTAIETLTTSLQSIEGSEILAENVFLLPLQDGSPDLLRVLRTLDQLTVKHRIAILQEKPTFVSS